MLQRGGVGRGSVITHIGGQSVNDINELAKVLSGVMDQQVMPVRLCDPARPNIHAITLIKMNR
jgi:hypothetical protein